jgi:hypothetical protein
VSTPENNSPEMSFLNGERSQPTANPAPALTPGPTM